jgi:hypothetical protein
MGELQLDDLIREQDGPQSGLEPEREVSGSHDRDASIASGSSPRLAHTLRRGSNRVAALSAVPGSQGDRPDLATLAMRRIERSTARAIPPLFDRDAEDPTAVLEAPLAAALLARATPATSRARATGPLPTPRTRSTQAASGELASRFAGSGVSGVIEGTPPGDVICNAASEPRRADTQPRAAIEPGITGEPRRPLLRSAWQSRVILPVALLVGLVAFCWLVRAILLQAIL